MGLSEMGLSFVALYSKYPLSPEENSIAFGKSTSQRIYPEQNTPKI